MKFYNEILSIVRLFQVFALSPIGITDTERLCAQLYSFVTLLVIVVLTVTASIYGFIRENSLQSIVGGLVFFAEIVTHVCVVIQSYATRHKHFEIYTVLNDIDDTFMRKLSFAIDYQRLRRNYYGKTFTLLTVLFVAIGAQLIYMILREDDFLLKHVFFMLFHILAIRVSCVQNIFYVDLVCDRLQWVGKVLNEMESKEAAAAVAVENSEWNVFAIGDGGDHVLRRRRRHTTEYAELLALKKVYGRIWDVSGLVNDCLGWSLLAVITHSFIHLTTHGYWLFLGLANMLPEYQIIDSIMDIAAMMLMMSLMCSACYKCTQCVSVYRTFFSFEHLMPL